MVSVTGNFVTQSFLRSMFLLFLSSSVMILLACLSCLLVFLFIKDQIASFQLKANRFVFELSVPCVCLFHCVIATKFDYRIQYDWFRVLLHAVDSLNFKLELRSKKIKQFCIMQTFPRSRSSFKLV